MIAVLAGLLLAAPWQQVTTRSTYKESPDSSARPFAEAEPDVLLRGRTARIVVRGRDLASLKTLTVGAPAGVTVRSLTPLAGASVSIDLSVAANAEPGERALLLTIAPQIQSSSGVRPGGDSVNGKISEMMGKVIQQRAEPEEYGWVYINSHELLVTEVKRGSGDEVLITVSDPEGDLEIPALPSSTSGLVLLTDSELVISEARCGGDVIDGVLEVEKVTRTGPGTVILAARLAREELPERASCIVRVRVHDKAKNTSPWFTAKGIVR